MKTRKLRKFLMLLASALLLVSVTVGATVAYLTSTDSVTNTFTVGNVALTLDEAPVDADGQATTGNRVKANSYKLFPGKEYDKDPTVHIDANSEDGWLFVKITNEISAIESTAEGKSIAAQMLAKGWVKLSGETGVYYYNRKVTKTDSNIVVFDNFTVAENVDNGTLAAYAGKTVKIQAYMVQADGFDSAIAAWAKAPTTWTAAN